MSVEEKKAKQREASKRYRERNKEKLNSPEAIEKRKAYSKSYYENNKDKWELTDEQRDAKNARKKEWDKETGRSKSYYLEKKEEINKKQKAWNKNYYEANKENEKQRQRSYYNQNAEEIKKKARESNQKKSYAKAYREENKEKCAKATKDWAEKNPGKVNSYNRARKNAQINRTPSWLTEGQIKEMQEMYAIAKIQSDSTGVKYHVDHIVPLQGNKVSGLHVPWNLQILTATENLSKSNSF